MENRETSSKQEILWLPWHKRTQLTFEVWIHIINWFPSTTAVKHVNSFVIIWNLFIFKQCLQNHFNNNFTTFQSYLSSARTWSNSDVETKNNIDVTEQSKHFVHFCRCVLCPPTSMNTKGMFWKIKKRKIINA